MQEIENVKTSKETSGEMRLMNDSANGMLPTKIQRPENRTAAVSRGTQVVVSEQQFLTVREEHLQSMNLLNSSANVLLSAMQAMVPPPDSGRVVGEYTAKGMRQISKSICDIIQTKTGVVRSMYSIARDEI